MIQAQKLMEKQNWIFAQKRKECIENHIFKDEVNFKQTGPKTRYGFRECVVIPGRRFTEFLYPSIGMLVLTVVFTALGLARYVEGTEPVVQPGVQPVSEVVLEPEGNRKRQSNSASGGSTWNMTILTWWRFPNRRRGDLARLDAYLTGVVAERCPPPLELGGAQGLRPPLAFTAFTLKADPEWKT